MTAYILVSAYLVLIAITAANARADDPPRGPVVAGEITATWACQTLLGKPHTFARSPWKPHSRGYWNAELRRWQARHRRCLQRLHARDSAIRGLQRGLAGTPMDGTAGQLEQVGRRYGINPAFIAAVACVESSCGAQACRQNRMNVWGLASCGNGWYVPLFASWGEAFAFFARFVNDRFGSARSPWDFHGYCVTGGHDCPDWPGKVAGYMRQMGSGSNVRYAVVNPGERTA